MAIGDITLAHPASRLLTKVAIERITITSRPQRMTVTLRDDLGLRSLDIVLQLFEIINRHTTLLLRQK